MHPPSYRRCPLERGKLKLCVVGREPLGLLPEESKLEPPALLEHAQVQAYKRVQQILPVAERIREAIRERAAVEPVPLGDGKALKSVDWPVTLVNDKIALRVIRDMHGEAKAAMAAPSKMTQEGIKRAVGNANFETVFAAIEKAGGVVRTTQKQVRTAKATAESAT